MEGFNIIVCVSQHVDGMFVTDMVQSQKHHAIKQAASKVLELLKEYLTNTTKKMEISPQLISRDSFYFDSKKVNIPAPGIVPTNKSLSQTAAGSSTWKVDF